ncbi:MAG: 6-bladed beta-propeller [Rhodothermaceae bacterium]|nr:6-bladed beta-propeller [Bacteroidota bacterium]MYE63074.1 6-bladed beta-propeller [Rhodothermaceae bacterium]MYJ19324.1 6-bladed beta-propeller [Rhodothermaceae bacterium]
MPDRLPYVRISVVLLVTVLLLPPRSSSQSVIHPTKENIPVSSDPRFELGHDHNEEVWSWDMMDMATVGVDEGNAHEMIGLIGNFDIDHSGTMYYVDLMDNQVRAYGYDGKFIADVSTAGSGPGEFRQPFGFAVLEGGRTIIVGDVGVDHVFQREGDTFKLISTNRPEYRGDALCAMKGYYYNQGYVEKQHDGVIHKYTLDGNWENSFGKPYNYEDSFIVSLITRDAMLACNAKHGVIAQVTNHIPAMTGYSEDGQELWQVTFSDYRIDTVLESVRDGRRYHTVLQEDGTSVFTSLFSDRDYFYVTYSFVKRDMGNMPPLKFMESHIFRVNARTGLGHYLGTGPEPGEHLLAVDGEYRFTTTQNEGFPQIRVYKPRRSR